MKVKSESEVAQSCPTLFDPVDCSPPGSSVHGIFQARVLEWGAIAFSERRALAHNLKNVQSHLLHSPGLNISGHKPTGKFDWRNQNKIVFYKQIKPMPPCFGRWNLNHWTVSSVQFSSAAQSCPTLGDPMECSTPGSPVHHQLLELIQIHVHHVGDAIQPSHPLSSPSPPAFNLSQHQGLFKWVSSSHQEPRVLEFQLQHQSFQWIFRTDFL